MIKFFRSIGVAARYAPAVLLDLAGLAGAGLLAYGAHMIYEPAGYVTAGILLLAGALLGNRRAP